MNDPQPATVALARKVHRTLGLGAAADDRSILLMFIAVLVVGCSRDNPQPASASSQSGDTATGVAAQAEAWIGRWSGPEGTYLQVVGANGVYEITITNLDGARTFKGRDAGDRITFERDGTKESLRPTDGNDTGMKWLAGKADCLTVKPGEGYCRD